MRFLLLVVLLFPQLLYSQRVNLDSLQKEVKKNPENLSAKFKVAEVFMNSKPDSAIAMMNRMLLLKNPHDTVFGKSYNILGNSYNTKNKLDTAEYYFGLATPYFVRAQHYYGQAVVLYNHAGVKRQKGQFASALEMLVSAEKFLLPIQHERKNLLLLLIYQNLAENYKNFGLFDKSIEQYYKAEKKAEELNDKSQVVAVYNGLGRMFTQTGDFQKGIAHYKKGVDLAKAISYKAAIPTLIFNMASTYFQYSLYDSSRRSLLLDSTEFIIMQLDQLYAEQRITSKEGTYYTLMGQVSQYRKNYARAINYYDSAIIITQKTKMGGDLAKAVASKGDAYEKAGDIPNAFTYYLKALDMFKANGAKNDLKQLYYHLAKLYFNTGDYTSAATYYDLYYPLMNELINEEKIRVTKQFEAKYELSEKEAKIQQQQNEIKDKQQRYEIAQQEFRISGQLAELESKNQKLQLLYKEKEVADKESKLFRQAQENQLREKNQLVAASIREATIQKQQGEIKVEKQKNILLVTGSAFAVLVVLLLGWLNTNIRRQKKQIEVQKQEILHNNRNSIQQLISIFSRQSETEGLKENSVANQERLYTLNLLNKLLYESGENNQADLREYLTQLTNAKEIGSGKTVKIELDSPSLKLKSNLLKDIGLIVNELTTNAIKYAFGNSPDSKIAIHVRNDEQMIMLKIMDNGTGLPEGFDLGQKRNSFGLEFVNDLVQQHHGSIRSYNNGGGCFDISLKIR